MKQYILIYVMLENGSKLIEISVLAFSLTKKRTSKKHPILISKRMINLGLPKLMPNISLKNYWYPKINIHVEPRRQ